MHFYEHMPSYVALIIVAVAFLVFVYASFNAADLVPPYTKRNPRL